MTISQDWAQAVEKSPEEGVCATGLLRRRPEKADIVPGAVVQVRNKIFSGNTIKAARNFLSFFTGEEMDQGIEAQPLDVAPGEMLEVVKGPHKDGRANIVLVKWIRTGQTGYVYWGEFRLSTDLTEERRL